MTIGPDETVVTLAVDLGMAVAGGGSEYTLRAAGGRGSSPATCRPRSLGAPLLLLVPSQMLTPSTGYVLTVRDPANTRLSVRPIAALVF